MKRLAFVLLAVAVLASRGASAQDPARLLKTAMDLELVDHDPKAAIEQYKKVVATGDRALAAQALLRMAGCYEKLGDADGQKRTLQQILKNHPSQPEATEARRRLGNSSVTVSKQLVWTKPSGASIVNVSPNGQYVLYRPGVDSDGLMVSFSVKLGASGLSLHDMTTGTDRPLASSGESGDLGFTGGKAAWSRDSQQIAYTSALSQPAGLGPRRQLRIVDLRTDGADSNRVVLDNPDIKDVWAHDWAPDRRTIALTLNRVDGTRQIALLTVANGKLQVLKTLGWRGADALSFSPDGRFLAFSLPAKDSPQTHVAVLAVDGGRELTVMRAPEDDSPLGWSRDGQELFFVRKRGEQDQLWTVAVNAKGASAEPRLIRDLGILNDRANLTMSGALYVYEQPRQAFALVSASFDFDNGTLTSNLGDAGRLLGSAASEDLASSLRFSPDGRLVAYRHRVRRANEVITIRNLVTGSAREFQPELQGGYRTIVWSPDSRFLALGGSDLDGRHGVFRLDVETGALTSIVVTTSADELVTDYVDQPWSADGARFYYVRIFEGGGKGRVLVERDLASGEERELMPRGTWAISLATDKQHLYYYDVSKTANVLMERAVASGEEREIARGVNGIALSPDGRFLATAVRPAGSTGRSALVVDLKDLPQGNQTLDAFASVLAWAPDGRAVIARKAVGVPGQVDFLFRQEFWWVPVDGRAPHRLLESHAVADERLSFSTIGPDGRLLVFQKTSLRPLPPVEVWRFENFARTAGSAR